MERPSPPTPNTRTWSPWPGVAEQTIVIVAALLAGAHWPLPVSSFRGGGSSIIILQVTNAVTNAVPSTVPPRSDGRRVPAPTPPTPRPPSGAGRLALPGTWRATWRRRRGVAGSPSGSGPATRALPEVTPLDRRPVGLQIESIDVASYPVRPVGLEPDRQMEIPDETEIGWLSVPSDGRPARATVLAAHVSWNRTSGPFALLGNVEPGDMVEVELDDGTVRRYEVIERAVYGKQELPSERIWRTSGDETLVLITCGGDYNPDVGRYRRRRASRGAGGLTQRFTSSQACSEGNRLAHATGTRTRPPRQSGAWISWKPTTSKPTRSNSRIHAEISRLNSMPPDRPLPRSSRTATCRSRTARG